MELINKIKTNKDKILNVLSCIIFGGSLIYFITMACKCASIPDFKDLHTYIYIALNILLLVGAYFIVRKITTTNKWYITVLCLTIVLIVQIFSMKFQSIDYILYLKNWTNAYRGQSLKDALCLIDTTSNYMPAYNYFLILIAKLPVNDLFAIKFVSKVFEVASSILIIYMIYKFTGDKVNIVVWLGILLVPAYLIETSFWGQCDAIYTFFNLLAIYYAINKKSKLSFAFFGVAFAFKMQSILTFPIALILLLAKDEKGEHYLKWKDMWLTPLLFVLIDFIPVLAGESPLNILKTYVAQASSEDRRYVGECANIAMLLDMLFRVSIDSTIYKILMPLSCILGISVTAFLTVFMIKYQQKHKITTSDVLFFLVCYCMLIVFTMPKMLDRFYYLASLFALLYAFVKKDNFSRYLAMLILGAFSFSLCKFNYSGVTIFIFMIIAILTMFLVATLILTFFIKNYVNESKNNLNDDEKFVDNNKLNQEQIEKDDVVQECENEKINSKQENEITKVTVK